MGYNGGPSRAKISQHAGLQEGFPSARPSCGGCARRKGGEQSAWPCCIVMRWIGSLKIAADSVAVLSTARDAWGSLAGSIVHAVVPCRCHLLANLAGSLLLDGHLRRGILVSHLRSPRQNDSPRRFMQCWGNRRRGERSPRVAWPAASHLEDRLQPLRSGRLLTALSMICSSASTTTLPPSSPPRARSTTSIFPFLSCKLCPWVVMLWS